MIYSVGDSHALCCFKDMGVSAHSVGPVTMRRLGHPEEEILRNFVNSIPITTDDIIIFCFGEIDVRCHVNPCVLRSKVGLVGMLNRWAEAYITNIAALDVHGAKKYIMSVVPPTPKANADVDPDFPVAGTDDERAMYTHDLNKLFESICAEKGLEYFDVWSKYVDEHGMLPIEQSDTRVHITDLKHIREMVKMLYDPPKSLTLVTALWDLDKRQGGNHRRTIQEYLEWGKHVLTIPQNMVIFCDPDLVTWIKLMRKSVSALTEVISMPFEQIPTYEWIKRISECGLPDNRNINKDTPEFIAMGWSKPFLMKDVATRNPFKTTHVGFIDFGIAHVVSPRSIADPQWQKPKGDRVNLHVLKYFNREMVSASDYYHRIREFVAAGYIVGSCEAVIHLAFDFEVEAKRIMALGRVSVDESILAAIAGWSPQKFSYSYGWFQQILSNHHRVVEGLEYVSQMNKDAKEHGECILIPGSIQAKHDLEKQEDEQMIKKMETIVDNNKPEDTIFLYKPGELIQPISDKGVTFVVPHKGTLDHYISYPGGLPERDMINWALDQVFPGGMFIDIGANIGTWSLNAAKLQKTSQVHSFEPQAEFVKAIQVAEMINTLHCGIWVHCVALGSRVGVADLRIPTPDYTGSSIAGPPTSEFPLQVNPLGGTRSVPVRTLDSFGLFSGIGLIKIDVEGHELEVLKGAVDTIKKNDYPKIILEQWISDWYKTKKEETLGFLKNLGYDIIEVSPLCDQMYVAQRPEVHRTSGPCGPVELKSSFKSSVIVKEQVGKCSDHALKFTEPLPEDDLIRLHMIVKNEAKEIEKVLLSVKPYIDSWVIVDTGSTDGTQKIIKDVFGKDIPGLLIERPIVTYADTGELDYAATRNMAMDLATDGKPVFFLLLNGTDVLEGGEAMRKFCDAHRNGPESTYHVAMGCGWGAYPSSRLTRVSKGWRYILPRHEYLGGPGETGQAIGVFLKSTDDPPERQRPKHEADAKCFKRWLQDHPDDTRALFYLAQSYECLNQWEAAAGAYLQRSEMGGWAAEAYEAKFRQGRCADAAQVPWEKVQQIYLEAHQMSPNRLEPLYAIAQHYHKLDNHALVCTFASNFNAPIPQGTLPPAVAQEVYKWQMADLMSIHAHYVGRRDVGRKAAIHALANGPKEGGEFLRIHRNRAWYSENAREMFPGFREQPIQVEMKAPWIGVNPSVCVAGGKRVAILRAVNFEPILGTNGYKSRHEDGVIRTQNWWVEFDSKWEMTSADLLIDETNRSVSKFPVEGYEDMRLFYWNRAWWATATVLNAGDRGDTRDTGQRCEIVLLRIDPVRKAIINCEYLRGVWSEWHQKNWRPCAQKEGVSFVYSSDPLCVIDVKDDDEQVTLVPRSTVPPPPNMLRGSSQVVQLPNGDHLWVDHEVSFDNNWTNRFYQHKMILADKNLTKVLTIGEPFHFHHEPGIEFCCGMALDGDTLVMSYGMRDKQAMLGFVPLKAALLSWFQYLL